jgi:hypothetical protein
MSLVDRCDEITRLIDDVLREFPPGTGRDETDDSDAATVFDADSVPQDDESTGRDRREVAAVSACRRALIPLGIAT